MNNMKTSKIVLLVVGFIVVNVLATFGIATAVANSKKDKVPYWPECTTKQSRVTDEIPTTKPHKPYHKFDITLTVECAI